MHWLRTTLRPDAYHGHGKRPPFFEGWYFKLVDAAEEQRYAIIPGVFLSHTAAEQHAFVQVLDGATGHATYHRFPFEQFSSARGVLDVRIGPNHFTAGAVHLDLDGEGQTVRGDLRFDGVTPWPVTLASPGIMGWYAWVPFMECYHGVVSLDHTIQGALQVNGRTVDLERGRGYTEKDWGRSFPDAWVWFQSNHFGRPGTCLTASVAIIPWIRRSFPGFIVGLWHEQRLYRWATYTGARTEHLSIGDERVEWVVRDRRFRLEMEATRAQGGLLRAPTTAGMSRRIAETLDATVGVQLSALEGGQARPVFAATGRHAGLEADGALARLQALWAGEK